LLEGGEHFMRYITGQREAGEVAFGYDEDLALAI